MTGSPVIELMIEYYWTRHCSLRRHGDAVLGLTDNERQWAKTGQVFKVLYYKVESAVSHDISD